MSSRTVRAALAGLVLAGAALAHAPDEGPRAPASGGTHRESSWRDWFSAPRWNETEAQVAAEQDQLAIRVTQARLSGASDADLADFDRQSDALSLRAKIARLRAERDEARRSRDARRAQKLERRIHAAKRDLAAVLAAAR